LSASDGQVRRAVAAYFATVRRRLPILSTYLGHGHVTDTYWYVTGTPELMAAVGQRLDKRWEGI